MKELQFGPEPIRLVVEWAQDGDRIQAEQNLTIQHRKENDMAQLKWQFNGKKQTDSEGAETGRSNGDRANSAQEALNSYDAARVKMFGETETLVTDLIADLLHYCDREGIDTEPVLRMAQEHHQEER